MMYHPNCYCFIACKLLCYPQSVYINLTVSSIFTDSSRSLTKGNVLYIASEASPLAQVRLAAKTRLLATPHVFHLGMLRSTRRRFHSPMCLLQSLWHNRRNTTICYLGSSMEGRQCMTCRYMTYTDLSLHLQT
jgi:hypothetical protein